MLSPKKQRAMVKGLPARASVICADKPRQWLSDVLCRFGDRWRPMLGLASRGCRDRCESSGQQVKPVNVMRC
jgi:hypothetical protein